jgi:hypothetical protein
MYVDISTRESGDAMLGSDLSCNWSTTFVRKRGTTTNYVPVSDSSPPSHPITGKREGAINKLSTKEKQERYLHGEKVKKTGKAWRNM